MTVHDSKSMALATHATLFCDCVATWTRASCQQDLLTRGRHASAKEDDGNCANGSEAVFLAPGQCSDFRASRTRKALMATQEDLAWHSDLVFCVGFHIHIARPGTNGCLLLATRSHNTPADTCLFEKPLKAGPGSFLFHSF